jgi:hypothetical protein|tara:strand:- start:1761 stop:2015 length:255 start_codon:yes stop_codon:yes gene_type:complete
MRNLIEGVFWVNPENEYNIQVTFTEGEEKEVSNIFTSWHTSGRGFDPAKNKHILIFKKRFPEKTDFEAEIEEIKQNTFLIKEVE